MGLNLSRKAVRITRSITAFEVQLVDAIIGALQKETWIESESTFRFGIELNHPTADSIGIKLLIPGRVKGVGEINATSVTAYFDHLRSAAKRFVRVFGVGSS